MISLQTYKPLTLSAYIKSFWCLKISNLLEQPYQENVIPDGHHEIIFHLKPNAAKRKSGENEWTNEPDAFIAGQTRKYYSLQLLPGSVLYGIRFLPHTLSLLLNVPAATLTDTIVSLMDIPKAIFLKSCITENKKQTFHSLEKVLLRTIKSLGSPSNSFEYVNASVKCILNQNGNVKVDTLLGKTGISGRHLDTVFQQYIGLNPKKFANIIRLNSFINYRNNNPNVTLTQCSYEAEFYDQAHLIKLFRDVIGVTPKAFFGKQNLISCQFSEL